MSEKTDLESAIAGLKEEKTILERKITALVQDFEKEAGLYIESLSYHWWGEALDGSGPLRAAKVEIKL